jgi:S-adenosylmethionine:tRNA ribosyltransferase-isomerase
MDFIPRINISDYDYPLPEDKIAQFPLQERDGSKLLIYSYKQLKEDIFNNLSNYLPEKSLLIFNETRVIQARLLFKKETGALIELFCLQPVSPTRELQSAFIQKSGVEWTCLVGNSKKWKSGKLVKTNHRNGLTIYLSAERVSASNDQSLIRFEWQPSALSFSEILNFAGITPLPPYMKREPAESDAVRYQTIFAKSEGSVAAPTAGLHFTEKVFHKLDQKKMDRAEVVLHVGAGTFKPVTQNTIKNHEMHVEKILIPKGTIRKLLDHFSESIAVVGTTSMRTIESLYWFGVKLIVDQNSPEEIDIRQWDAYNPIYNCEISSKDALMAVLKYCDNNSLETLSGQTQLMIVPGYRFRIPNILITNFHIPRSTLLLLVSAFIGKEWKQAYNYALNHDFRFLSYGDACLFFKQNEE